MKMKFSYEELKPTASGKTREFYDVSVTVEQKKREDRGHMTFDQMKKAGEPREVRVQTYVGSLRIPAAQWHAFQRATLIVPRSRGYYETELVTSSRDALMAQLAAMAEEVEADMEVEA